MTVAEALRTRVFAVVFPTVFVFVEGILCSRGLLVSAFCFMMVTGSRHGKQVLYQDDFADLVIDLSAQWRMIQAWKDILVGTHTLMRAVASPFFLLRTALACGW